MLAVGCGDSADNNANNDANNMTNNGENNASNNASNDPNNMSNNASNNASNDPNNMSNNMTNTGGVSFSTEIVPIVADSCANAGCHLDPGNGTSFMVGEAEDAAAVQAAWEGVMTAGGTALIGATKEESEVWLRVSGTDGAPMPFGSNGLPPAEADLIGAWIDEGADFSN